MYTKINFIDRAVANAKRFFMNWDGGNDKNLLPPFSDWTLHANAVVTSPYVLTLTATATLQYSSITIPVLPNTAYIFSSGGGSFWGVNQDQSGGFISNMNGGTPFTTYSFTTASNVYSLQIRTRNDATGTFTYTNPQLELGSTATAFAPKKLYTITQSPGTVTQAGTPLNAANLNKMEQGIYDAHVTADGALQRTGGTITGNVVIDRSDSGVTLKSQDPGHTNEHIRITNFAGQLQFQDLGGSGIWVKNILGIDRVSGTMYPSRDVMIGPQGAGASSWSNALYLQSRDASNNLKQNFLQADPNGALMFNGNMQVWHDGRMRVNSGGTYIEWWNGSTWQGVGGLKSIQRGAASAPGQGTLNVAISAVNMAKAVVSLDAFGNLEYTTSGATPNTVYALLTSSTNLQIVGTGGVNTVPVAWQVIEYY